MNKPEGRNKFISPYVLGLRLIIRRRQSKLNLEIQLAVSTTKDYQYVQNQFELHSRQPMKKRFIFGKDRNTVLDKVGSVYCITLDVYSCLGLGFGYYSPCVDCLY